MLLRWLAKLPKEGRRCTEHYYLAHASPYLLTTAEAHVAASGAYEVPHTRVGKATRRRTTVQLGRPHPDAG